MLEAEGLLSLLAPLAKLPAPKLVGEAEAAILDWAERVIRDDLCLVVLRPRPE